MLLENSKITQVNKMADKIKIVKTVFHIPDWYEFSDFELRKLYSYIKEASCPQEARLFRILDCSAFCYEDKCFSVVNFRAHAIKPPVAKQVY